MAFSNIDDDDDVVSSNWSTANGRSAAGGLCVLSYAREQRVPRAMVLRAIRPSTGKPTLKNAEMAHLLDLELLPSVPRTALTLAANLKP